MQNPQRKYEEFRNHNLQTSIVMGEWLDEQKKSIVNGQQEMSFLRYKFVDGSTRTLAAETVKFGNKRGFKPRWMN